MSSKTFILLLALTVTTMAQPTFFPTNIAGISNDTDSSSGVSAAESTVTDIGNAAAVCAQAFLSEIPSSFCWKNPPDFGIIPEDCAPGTFRSAALCYDNCDSGYGFWGGVCWEDCDSGYTNEGATCYKSLIHWYFKKSYIPASYTNFSGKSVCPSNMYKSGALCYVNCSADGLDNCGIGACASSSASCAKGILEIGIEAIEAIAKLVKFVVTLGTDSGTSNLISTGTNAIQGAIDNGAEDDLSKGLALMKMLLTNTNFKDEVLDKMVAKTSAWAGSTISDKIIAEVCSSIADHFINTSTTASSAVSTFDWPTTDAPTIVSTIKECQNMDTEDEKLACAKEVLDLINEVDPTGITGLVASFIQPVCTL